MDGKVKGPEFYFPSIEAKYGKSIEGWQALMVASGLTTHGELVAWLKAEHGFGHGHATAITGHLLSRERPAPDRDQQVARLFPAAKAHWRPYYDALAAHMLGFGGVTVLPKQGLVGFGAGAQFAVLQPATPDRFDVGLKLPGVAPTARLEPAGRWGGMMTHRIRVHALHASHAPGEPDSDLLGWLREAYDMSRERREVA